MEHPTSQSGGRLTFLPSNETAASTIIPVIFVTVVLIVFVSDRLRSKVRYLYAGQVPAMHAQSPVRLRRRAPLCGACKRQSVTRHGVSAPIGRRRLTPAAD
jgi:hypothetical protein